MTDCGCKVGSKLICQRQLDLDLMQIDSEDRKEAEGDGALYTHDAGEVGSDTGNVDKHS